MIEKKYGENIANKLKIDKVYAELLPDGKVQKIEELKKKTKKNGKMAFVRRWNK